MIIKRLSVLKKFSLIISVLYTLILSCLSLIKLKEVVPKLPSFSDKVAHIIAHFIFVALWFIAFFCKFNFKYNKAIIYAAVFSIVYGAIIELLQGWLTASRQSDFNDVFANVLGMVFAALFLIIIKKRVLKNNNTLLF